MPQPPTYNLLNEKWLRVRRRSGAVSWIAPHEITAGYNDDPALALAFPRPDFNGALTEFLIGLVATAAPPARNERKLYEPWFKQPPAPAKLAELFAPYADAFNLDGDGPRFMQDFETLDAELGAVGGLVIDAPGENTLKRNADLFVKRGGVEALGRAAAAAALYTLQTYAPSGGAGHRTSMRGGGPLTTLALPLHEDGREPTLWERVWSNVPSNETLASLAVERVAKAPKTIFPWLAPTRTSEKGKRTTTPSVVHPAQCFWGMPRRIRLEFEPADGRRCAVTGEADAAIVVSYRAVNYGINYEGFMHPLSPYYRPAKDGAAYLPVHGKAGGITYRHYAGLVAAEGDMRKPARCVADLRERAAGRRLRLHAFGYVMDNAKARAWIDSQMPIVGDASADAVAARLVKAARIVANAAEFAVKSALFENPKDAKGDFSHISDRLWRETEDAFFQALADAPASGSAAVREHAEAWRRVLVRAAFALFDEAVPMEGLAFGGDMERAVNARKGLWFVLQGYTPRGAELFSVLGLEAPEMGKSAAKRKAKGKED